MRFIHLAAACASACAIAGLGLVAKPAAQGAARPCIYPRGPGPFPRAPGKRTSGQMARFSLFQKKSPIRDGIGTTVRRQAAVRFLRARR